MNLVSIHEGLADGNRLRIVFLLIHGPLGVKHLQGILGISQVRVSKHLAYLRERGVVEVARKQNWMLYRIPADPHPALRAQFDCLRESVRGVAVFEADLAAREAIEGEVGRIQELPVRAKGAEMPGRITATEIGPAGGGAAEDTPHPGSDAERGAPSRPGATWVPYGEGDYVD